MSDDRDAEIAQAFAAIKVLRLLVLDIIHFRELGTPDPAAALKATEARIKSVIDQGGVGEIAGFPHEIMQAAMLNEVERLFRVLEITQSGRR